MLKIPNKELQMQFVEAKVIDENPYLAFKQLLTVAILSVICLVLTVFIFLHLFVTGCTNIFILNFTALIFLLSLLYSIHKTKQIGWSGHLFSVAIILFFIAFAYLNENKELSLIWAFFAPFVIIAVLGRKVGTLYLFMFFIMLFYQAYSGIGQWDSKTWTELSFLRFAGALLLAFLIAWVTDLAYSDLDTRLKNQRKLEAQYRDELTQLTRIDDLTQLYNRGYFNEILNQRLKTLARTDTHLVFFIIDIDFFKFYNDAFGHLAGDKVLKTIATRIHEYIKRYDDLVFRLGGEEFGGVITSENPEETIAWLAGLTDFIEDLDIKHAPMAKLPKVTISVGVYSCLAREVGNISDLYRAADEALYQAKDLGRNRMVVNRSQGFEVVT